jgi:hypothetical protein
VCMCVCVVRGIRRPSHQVLTPRSITVVRGEGNLLFSGGDGISRSHSYNRMHPVPGPMESPLPWRADDRVGPAGECVGPHENPVVPRDLLCQLPLSAVLFAVVRVAVVVVDCVCCRARCVDTLGAGGLGAVEVGEVTEISLLGLDCFPVLRSSFSVESRGRTCSSSSSLPPPPSPSPSPQPIPSAARRAPSTESGGSSSYSVGSPALPGPGLAGMLRPLSLLHLVPGRGMSVDTHPSPFPTSPRSVVQPGGGLVCAQCTGHALLPPRSSPTLPRLPPPPVLRCCVV